LFLYIFLTFFCLIFIHAPIITLFPYTTLFRSRVYFNNIICSIPLYIFHIFPIGRLFSTNTRNPYFKPLYGTMQRFNFAYITTFFPVFYRFIEAGGSFFRDHFHYSSGILIISFYRKLILLECPIPYIICFRKKTSRFQCKKRDFFSGLCNQMCDNLIFYTERSRKNRFLTVFSLHMLNNFCSVQALYFLLNLCYHTIS